MPIIDDSAPVIRPANNMTLVKYLDLTKFISLLFNNSLFFCRLDRLEDQFEGTTAKRNRQSRINSMINLNNNDFFQKKLTIEEIEKNVNIYFDFEKRLKEINLVNCWNKKNIESAALWKIYSANGVGIMLKSSVESLINSLQNSTETIRISEVRYIDYDTEVMPDGNTMFPIIHKQNAYSYEDEVRLIHEVKAAPGFPFDWSSEKTQEGKYIHVDVNTLINEIVIGPFTSKWIIELIKDLCSKYNLTKKISLSRLAVND